MCIVSFPDSRASFADVDVDTTLLKSAASAVDEIEKASVSGLRGTFAREIRQIRVGETLCLRRGWSFCGWRSCERLLCEPVRQTPLWRHTIVNTGPPSQQASAVSERPQVALTTVSRRVGAAKSINAIDAPTNCVCFVSLSGRRPFGDTRSSIRALSRQAPTSNDLKWP